MNFDVAPSNVKAAPMPPWAGALALFLVLVPIYLLSIDMRASWGASITGDEPFYLITTQSLLQDGDLDTSNQFATSAYESFFDHSDGLWYQSIPRPDGSLLSPHNPGLSVLLLPGFALGGLLGAQVEMVLITAATFALTFLLIGLLTRRLRIAWVSVFAVALTTPVFVYSSEIYPEFPAALAVVAGLVALSSNATIGLRRAALLVLILTALPWLGSKYIPLAVILGIYSMWRGCGLAKVLILAAGIMSAAAYIWFHLNVFGGLTPYSLNLVYTGQTTTGIIVEHVEFFERVYRLWGLFIDQRFGIGRWAPLLLLGAIVTPCTWNQGKIARLVLSLLGVQLLVATFIAITMMGWWFPGRTLMTVLPLIALPIATFWIRSGPAAHVGIVGITAYSLTVTVALAFAGHAREVVLAVNPFDMQFVLFAATASLFPNYTSWSLHTWGTTVVWLVLLGAAITNQMIPLGRLVKMLARRSSTPDLRSGER